MNMKIKWGIFSLLLLVALGLNAENMYITIMPEGMSAALRNAELTATNPNLLDEITGEDVQTGDLTNNTDQSTQSKPIASAMEFTVSGATKAVTLPIGYHYKNFGLNCKIPYIYERTVVYMDATKSSNGVGDVSAELSYMKRFGQFKTDFGIDVKLPTGDDVNVVDGYVVPLGTGSTDFKINASFAILHKTKNAAMVLSTSYFKPGMSKKKVQSVPAEAKNIVETLDYEVTNGATFNVKGTYMLETFRNLYLSFVLSYTNIQDGETDIKHSFDNGAPGYKETGIPNYQDMQLSDFVPSVIYSRWLFDFAMVMQVPIMSEYNDNASAKERDLTFKFVVTRNF